MYKDSDVLLKHKKLGSINGQDKRWRENTHNYSNTVENSK